MSSVSKCTLGVILALSIFGLGGTTQAEEAYSIICKGGGPMTIKMQHRGNGTITVYIGFTRAPNGYANSALQAR